MSWAEARNILCIRLDAMGDLLMTTPAMKSLKEAVPGRRITLLTSDQGARMAASIPFIDEVIPYGAPWLKVSSLSADPIIDIDMIERLKSEKFDGAVIFTVYSQSPLPSALMCYLAEIPLRAAHCRENPYALLTDWIQEEEPHKRVRHEVRRQLDLVKKLGASGENRPLTLKVDNSSHVTLWSKLKERHITEELNNWIVIHPGATAASRRYQPHLFAQAADLLIERLGRKILFTGDQNEWCLIESIRTEMKGKSENLGGDLTLKEMIALIGQSQLLIANNSGPVHMAAALGTPVVVLYALTNPQHTPWMIPHFVLKEDVPCSFCYKSICPEGTNACLNVPPERVFKEASELLKNEMGPAYDYEAINPLPHERRNYDHA